MGASASVEKGPQQQQGDLLRTLSLGLCKLKVSNDVSQPEPAVKSAPVKEDSTHDLQRRPTTVSFADSRSVEHTPVESFDPDCREVVILHFNDVYNIEAREAEPVGGAARFVTKVKSFVEDKPLVMFSGDAFNPSIMSTVTKGKQMVPVLNACGVHVACVGNHDLDFGIETMDKLISETKFPWLASNVIDKTTGKPLGGSPKTHMFQWNGINIGCVGLVEEEWLVTLGSVNPETLDYIDFVTEGQVLVRELRAKGAEIVVALTHMRVPNDMRLAQEVAGIDLVLGGHDHHYEVIYTQPYGTPIFKSGTDFRDLTRISVKLMPGRKPRIESEHFEITSDIVEDPEIATIVGDYMKLVGTAMEEEIGETAVELESRFKIIRTQEANIGNLICDIWRESVSTDVVVLNSGTIRSDTITSAGVLKMKDLVAMLPMIDETCVMECDNDALLKILENGVSQYPKLEGRFPQVSGVRFSFDPTRPPGQRVIPETVLVNDQPLDDESFYRVATKAYLAQGKDGYDVFTRCREVQGPNESPTINTLVRNHFEKLQYLTASLQPGGPTLDPRLVEYKNHLNTLVDDERSSFTAVYDRNTNKYVLKPRVDGRITNLNPAS